MSRRLPVVALAAALVLAGSPLAAQRREKEPARPRLDASADTNDAWTYYNVGLARLSRDADMAADAFYWAARLNPVWAEPLYARRVALLLQDERRLERYWSGDRRTIQSDEVRRIDSLYYRALMINPFLYEKLDEEILQAVIRHVADEAAGSTGNRGAIAYEIEQYLRGAPASTRAWRAYCDGRLQEALELYAQAIGGARRPAPLHILRGRIFFQLDHADSALAELTAGLQEMRKRDTKETVYLYESKALVEQSIGMIHVRRGDVAAAREAFGRALTEDMSYYPAHVQLAMTALDQKDTATALNELDLAVQIRADDAGLREMYGFALVEARRFAEAEVQLRKAIELDPVYAMPHYMLAKGYEAQTRPREALAAYRAYLARAGRGDAPRAEVEARVKELAAGGVASGEAR